MTVKKVGTNTLCIGRDDKEHRDQRWTLRKRRRHKKRRIFSTHVFYFSVSRHTLLLYIIIILYYIILHTFICIYHTVYLFMNVCVFVCVCVCQNSRTCVSVFV